MVEVATSPKNTTPGFIFATPAKGAGQYGPMILDEQGEPVWFDYSEDRQVRDFRTQIYQGEPVLTWWEGEVSEIYGIGEYVILDSSYQEIARLKAGNGYEGDLHEFKITPHDTALVTSYNQVRRDDSPLDGPEGLPVLEGIAQELDIPTGEVLFEWHSLDHVGIEESYSEPSTKPWEDYDYFHINSVDLDHDGNFLVSARNTWTVYKIERHSGQIIWRLGGKKSDFEMGPGTGMAFQHDARRQDDGTITIFDNGAAPDVHARSRNIVVELDFEKMKATMKREYTHPGNLLAGYLGSMQTLENANVFVGWGEEPYFSEFSRDGELLLDGRFPPEYTSYRTYRLQWQGHPADKPALFAEPDSKTETTLYASWNGATQVADWQVLAGPGPENLKPVDSVPQSGFETSIKLRSEEPYVAARARNDSGTILGTSKPVELEG